MPTEDNIFNLRFFENGVTPESFSAKELGALIIAFYEGLKELIDVRYPDVNSEEIRLSIVGIKNTSEDLLFKTSDQVEVSLALNDFGSAVSKKTYTDLPTKSYHAIKHIHSIVKSKGCKVELVEKNNRLFVVTPEDEFIEQKKVLVKSNMVLYGELNKIGGDKTKAWVQLYDGSKITFPINENQLFKLRGKVKEPIAIQGEAKWNVISKRIVQFKLHHVIDYTPFEVSKGFEQISKISRGWDDINTDSDLRNYLKGEA